MRHRRSGPWVCATITITMAFFWTACQSPQKKQAIQEIIPAEREAQLSHELSHNLDKAFGLWNDSEADHILNEMLTKLVAADAHYLAEVKNPRIHIIATQTPYVAAGLENTIYISRGAIEAILYENELAFVLSTELSLLKDKVPTHAVASLQTQEVGESLVRLPTAPPVGQKEYLERGWFEPGGLFDYGSNAYLKAETDAIRLMYEAKYDPRGSITLIQRWTTPPEDEKLQKLGKIFPDTDERMTAAREEVAKLSPLRDPIVRSLAFDKLQSRLHVKKAKRKKKI